MTHPTLPPRGIFVPTALIFHPELPSVVLVTWIQLRCLAWDGWATPALSLPEIAAQIGVHPARLNKHMAQLQSIAALTWHTVNDGKIILSFPEEPTFKTENHIDAQSYAGTTMPSPEIHGIHVLASYFPPKIMGYLSFDDDEEIDLNVDENIGNKGEANARQARSFSELSVCKSLENAVLPK